MIRAGLIVLAAFIPVSLVVSGLTSTTTKTAGTNQTFTLSPLASGASKTEIYTKPFNLEKGSASLTLKTGLDYEKWSEFNVELVPANPQQFTNDSSKTQSSGATYSAMTTEYKSFSVSGSGEYQMRLEGNWED